MLKIGVIFGGNSVEHEVSIISAHQAMMALDKEKYEVIPIYIGKDNEWYTGEILKDLNNYRDLNAIKYHTKNVVLYKRENGHVLQSKSGFKRIVEFVDVILPIVHGTNVEDGTLQGYLETINIPYVGSLTGAVLGQDKVIMKQIFDANLIPISDYFWFYDYEYLNDEKDILKKIKDLGYPVMIKPACLGSSVGVTKVKNEKEIKEAIEEVINFDCKIVVEKVVENLIEVNASVLGDYKKCEVSAIEEVMGADEFLSYQDKYIGSDKKTASKGMASTNRVIPARISKDLSQKVEELSLQVFRVLNGFGVCRIDYLIDKKANKVYVNEINTIPGSLSFYLWQAKGKKYPELLDELIKLAINQNNAKAKRIFSFETNILENYGGTKGSKGKLKF